MDKLDLIFSVIFIVGTVISMILIISYNKRHSLVEEHEYDDFVVEKKNPDGMLYESGDTFDWDLHESDLIHDFGDFAGFGLWKNKELASKRILTLKESYDKNNKSLKINMLESMIIISKYGDDITLDEDGKFRVNEIHMDNFMNGLEYDLEMIKLIAEIKEELNFSIENYEVDARQIFYIMKNAKVLGLYNINSNSQIFLFAKKHNSTIIDENKIIEDKFGISQMEIIVSELGGSIDNEVSDAKVIEENIYEAFQNKKRLTRVYKDIEGRRVTEYPNGVKIIKNGLWEAEEIIEEDKKVEKKSFYSLIGEEDVDDVMEGLSDSSSSSDGEIIGSSSKTSIVKNKKQNINIETNINHESDNIKNEIKILSFDRIRIKNNEGELVYLDGYCDNIETVDDLMTELALFSSKNIRALLTLILMPSKTELLIDDKVYSMHFIEDDNRHFVSYESIFLVLLYCVKDKRRFIEDNQLIKDGGIIIYPSTLIVKFLDFLEKKNMFIFLRTESFKYYKNRNGYILSVRVLELTDSGKDITNKYNSSDVLANSKVSTIKKTDFKMLDESERKIININHFLDL